MEKLKVCIVSAVQTSFWGSGERAYENRDLPRLRELAAKMEFELCAIEQPISDGRAAEAARMRIEAMKPDFLMIQVSTFAAGEILLPLAETGLRIGLWGVPEAAENGAIPNNSFCGVNMYAGILRQYLRYEPKYKWFYGDVQDELFLNRFCVTVHALRALKHLQGAKIGLIGGVAPGFYDLHYDARIAKRKLGVSIDDLLEFSDVQSRAMAYTAEQIRPAVEELRAEYVHIRDDMDSSCIELSARVYLAFQDLVVEHDFDAIAISCWPRFRKEMGIVVCSVIGRLLDHGILAACEGDVDSIITAMLLRDLSGHQPMLMDLSKFDERDQSLLMWHCGSAPSYYADSAGCTLAGHYKPGSRITGEDSIKVAGVNDLYFAPRPVTVARLTCDYQQMMLFSGELIDKQDRSYDGSRGWIGGLSTGKKALAVRDLVETLLSQGFQHHYPIVEGHVEDELREVMAWLNIRPMEFYGYRNYLQDRNL